VRAVAIDAGSNPLGKRLGIEISRNRVRASFSFFGRAKKKKKNLIACRGLKGLGRVVGPLLAARALPLRCAASTVLSSTLLAI
jgi:hypothetical protein